MNILIYLDQEKKDYHAIAFIKRLARTFPVALTLLYIVSEGEDQEQGEAILAQTAGQCADVAVRTLLRWGDPVGVLLSEARREKHDLLIIQSGGKKRANRRIESIENIISQSIYPAVLILRGALRKVKRILICTGGPEGHGKVIESGADMAQALGAKATLLHVAAGAVPTMYTGLPAFEESLEDLLKTDTAVSRHLRAGAEILDARNINGELELRRGIPIDEIVREARLGEYDLVVIGRSRIFSGWKEIFMSDITQPILNQVAVSVLVVGEKALH
ncbi:MAG: universal stress protein [Chloroflexi bacterium]|jgi:nucleotide-binding universal stress UspA family protein|nr:universal stress protein [Chloroflexota bacterium]